jgi:FkbM family methyltransferase
LDLASRGGLRVSVFIVFVAVFKRLSRFGFRRSHSFDRLYWLLFMSLSPKTTVLIRLRRVRIVVDTRDLFVSSLLIRDSVYEEFEVGLLEQLLSPGKVFVDVGAQLGYYTVIAGDICGKAGRVYSFEPNPRNFGLLVENIRVNGLTNVLPGQVAISDHVGRAKFYSDSFNWGKHSLSSENVTAFDERGETIDVETTSLEVALASAHERKVDVLKIDAEGAEARVIQGAGTILNNPEIILFVEVWPFGQRNLGTDSLDMFAQLKAAGFKCWMIEESRRQLLEIVEAGREWSDMTPRHSFNVIFSRQELPLLSASRFER